MQLDRIVGVESYTSFPPELTQKPQVGGRLAFSVDAIVAQDGSVRRMALQYRRDGLEVAGEGDKAEGDSAAVNSPAPNVLVLSLAKAKQLESVRVYALSADGKEMTESAVDRMKTSAEPIPVIVVGGGSILVSFDIAGASELVKPPHFEAANAVGAAIAQISGEVDRVYSLAGMSREAALDDAKAEAAAKAAEAGADPATIQIVDVEDVPLAYLPGNATRIRVKAVGDLSLARG